MFTWTRLVIAGVLVGVGALPANAHVQPTPEPATSADTGTDTWAWQDQLPPPPMMVLPLPVDVPWPEGEPASTPTPEPETATPAPEGPPLAHAQAVPTQPTSDPGAEPAEPAAEATTEPSPEPSPEVTPAASPAASVSPSPPPHAPAPDDVTGDGVSDLVAGTGPYHVPRVAPEQGGSIVVVPGLRGEPGRYTPPRARLFSQDSPGQVPGEGEAGDDFGAALARGDFNGDGVADVAVGAPGEDLGKAEDAGSVTVLRGSARSLVPREYLTQEPKHVPGSPEAYDWFGSDLAAGDFDGDGIDDLAVGVPGEGLGRVPGAGMVSVFRGTNGGLRPAGTITQATPGIAGNPEASDFFGTALAAGDVTGDGIDDLVVAADNERLGQSRKATGMIHLVPGSRSGLTGRGSTAVGVNRVAVQGTLGDALAVGRFSGGRHADVAAYVEAARGEPKRSGALVEIRGGPNGLGRPRVLHQDSPGMPEKNQADDAFGGALAVSDIDGDGADDLVVGGVGKNQSRGMIWLVPGGARGLLTRPATSYSQNGAPGELFGIAATVANLDGSGRAGVVVSAPGEQVAPRERGALFVIELDGFKIAGARRLSRRDLGGASAYGPSAPLSGGSVAFLPSVEAARRSVKAAADGQSYRAIPRRPWRR